MPGETLLLVEDHEITREGLAVILGRAGYNVAGVSDGKAALDYLVHHLPPDLILLDMLMSPPGYDGWQFLRQRSLVPALASIPVVITTALGIASQEWATSLGASGLLKKPFDPDTMLAEVRRCLAAGPRQEPCRVLLIEDQHEERFLLGLFLKSHGFHVEEAVDGRQGLRRALALQPEAALVDIDLPFLDGYEVARQIRAALGSRIRLIALTAYGQPGDQQRAAEAGFDLHLTKPADPVEIVRHLEAA